MSDGNPGIASFVAIGDSFTEGMNDPAPGGEFRGWADRVAEVLALRDPGFRYANLAVRGKLLRQIVSEQVPAALSLLDGVDTSAALVSIAGGGNDLLRPGGDPDTLAELFDAAVARLRQAGSRVVVFTGFDPRAFRLLGLLRGKIATYNMHLLAIADARGCDLVDLWSMRFLASQAALSSDRLHLTPEAHRRISVRTAEVLGVTPAPAPDGTPPPIAWSSAAAVKPRDRAAWAAARREDYQWAREYLGPWVGRRVRGTSSGDGRQPKRPELLPVTPAVRDLSGWACGRPREQGAGYAVRCPADRELRDTAVREGGGGHRDLWADRREARPDEPVVRDDQDTAAGRMRQRAGKPEPQARGHTVVVLPAGEGAVELPGLPPVDDVQEQLPCLRVGSPLEVPDVKLAQFLHDGHGRAGGSGDDLRGLGSPAQWRGVDGGRRRPGRKPPCQRAGLG